MATVVSMNQSAAPPLHEFENDTLTKIFFYGIDRFGGPSAMKYNVGGEWRALSHAEVQERVTWLAAGLEGLGVGHDDRVGILSENRPEWALADYAVLCLGAVDVPLYATLPASQISYILQDAGVKAIFVSTRDQLQKILEIRAEIPTLKIVAFDDPGSVPDVLRYEELLVEGRRRAESAEFGDLRARALAVESDHVATLIYTSGTTGHPKGVMLTHYNITSNVEAVRQHAVLDLGPGDIALSFLPLSHSFERMVDYYYWNSGATIAYVDAVEKVAESMVQVHPHVVCAAPRVFEKIFARVMGVTGIKKSLVLWAKG